MLPDSGPSASTTLNCIISHGIGGVAKSRVQPRIEEEEGRMTEKAGQRVSCILSTSDTGQKRCKLARTEEGP